MSNKLLHWDDFLWSFTSYGRLLHMVVYFSCEEMLLNVLFSDVPIEFTAATITIEIPAAMSYGGRSRIIVRETQNKLPHWGALHFDRSVNAALPAFRPSKLDQ
jgi:hypothetical protein